jgi:hypothetical protein
MNDPFNLFCQISLGAFGLIGFFRTDRVVEKYSRRTYRLTLQEVRRGSILLWLSLALGAVLRIYDVFYPHISN